MPAVTIVLGSMLILLGLVGFLATGADHPTALIPAGVGLLFIGLGLWAKNPAARKHAMHVAATLALLGFIAGLNGIVQTIEWMGGTEPPRPAAAISKAIMSLLCIVFVAMCIRSFIAARRARSVG